MVVVHAPPVHDLGGGGVLRVRDNISKSWLLFTGVRGRIDASYYKLDVNGFICKDWCPDSKNIFKLEVFIPMGSKGATQTEDLTIL